MSAAIDADIRRMTKGLCSLPPADDHSRRCVGQLTALAFVAAIDDPSRIRRSRDVGAYLGLGPQAVSVGRGRLHRRHLEMRGPAGANAPVRGRQRHADPLQGPAQTRRGAGVGPDPYATPQDNQRSKGSRSAPIGGSGQSGGRLKIEREGPTLALLPLRVWPGRGNLAGHRPESR